MELGEKIRQARTEAGLSQRQLCGEEITRNMLSQIESGKARPSMTTLQYLAARLDKPVSFFLEEDALLSPSDAFLRQARKAYMDGHFQQALDCLSQCRCATEEGTFLEYLCLTELGRQVLAEGKRPYARQLLERAGNLETPYKTPALEQERLLLLAQADGEEAIPFDHRPLLLLAEKALSRKEPAAAIRYLEAIDARDARWALLRGESALRTGDAKTALPLLQQAEEAFPQQAIPLLELCCKELEDYKMAYHYACLQR